MAEEHSAKAWRIDFVAYLPRRQYPMHYELRHAEEDRHETQPQNIRQKYRQQIHYVAVNGLVAGAGTYVIGLLGAIAGACILFLIPIVTMRNRETKYPFYEDEMYGFAEKKIKAMH